ncbi:protein N-terminal asparagine amidohydrolase-like [Lethenteron reissneri]|uniref:protein N-terminal asparagine amidohydrolase-like n=1 Tax=Lethenteron reissneri TaxID=7753 RepID=UPI002AB79695|nr:protein N-terminal asparagine amidohydrolase-like [Lethenteron reissneri]
MGVMYCRARGELTVQPIAWTRWHNVTLWLVQPDEVIRQFLSTSPLVEPPDFAANMRQLMRFMLLHPEPATRSSRGAPLADTAGTPRILAEAPGWSAVLCH